MKRLEPLDYARFLAAMCVVAFHYLFNGIHNGKISSIDHIPALIDWAKYGYLGVDLFFMISGYVIFFSARNRSAEEFVVSRAVRLYPTFWMAVIFTSVAAQFWGGQTMSVGVSQMVANLTMIPRQIGYPFVDGVYWTLQFELGFYSMILLCLMVGMQNRLESLLLLWPFAILIARAIGLDHAPLLGSYFCYFAAGSAFAIHKSRPNAFSAISLLLCLYLCVSFAVNKAPELSASREVPYSSWVIGGIVAAMFVFFALLNTEFVANLRLRGARLAGGLTYPIYLIHAHFGYMFISRFANDENKLLVYGITLALVLSISYLTHVLVEKRYSKAWHALFAATLGKLVSVTSRAAGRLGEAAANALPRTRTARNDDIGSS